ncbi:MAG: response regulator [Zhongshania sp.]|nr:response regulator [Zhongshania sp.]
MTPYQNILIVEDLPDVADWLYRVCGDCFEGADIRTANSISSAKSSISDWVPQLALLDIGLPDGSGIGIMDDIFAVNPSCQCVITTIFDDSNHLFDALKAGANGYLLKDEIETVFTARLKGILEGQPPLSPSIARRMLNFFQPQKAAPEAEITPREKEVLTLIAHGYSVRSTAESLSLSHHTVASYVKEIYRKLQINSRAEATLKAMELGLITQNK